MYRVISLLSIRVDLILIRVRDNYQIKWVKTRKHVSQEHFLFL